MPYVYRPRGAPARYFEGAPDVVKAGVLVIHGPFKDSVCEYDVLLKGESGPDEIVGLDFGAHGSCGCHFFLKPHDARGYRERNRRKRVKWADLPEPTRKAVAAYLEWNPDA